MDHRGWRRGCTLVDCAGATLAVGGLMVLGGLGLQQPRTDARIKKDSTQIRGIHQAMVVWAQNNGDRYPLPSVVDANDDTVKEAGRAKDTSGNIYSLLVYNGAISTEILVGPLENNPSVAACQTFEFDQPKKAARPAKALWDPGLRVGLGPEEKGNVSYAHLQPSGKRGKRWANTFKSDEVVLSSRGPEISGMAAGEGGAVVPTFANPETLTMRVFGGAKAWMGHMVTNDNHVELVRSTLAHQKPFTSKTSKYTAGGTEKPDIWFYDEPDDAESRNTYIGLFTKAGEKPADFKAVWD